jgi:predicted HicB family RNase H-like nuclease
MPETVVHFQIRMPPALHERLASLALERKQSLNTLVVEALRAALEARTLEQPDGVARG